MIKVGLVTNWNDTCGIAEYARNLVKYSSKVSYRVIPQPCDRSVQNGVLVGTTNTDMIADSAKGVDILHFNYITSLFLGVDWGKLRHHVKQPWVLTLHESTLGNVVEAKNTNMFQAIVTHEQLDGADHIPMPVISVPDQGGKIANKIGFVGLPFPWKGFYSLAKAARVNGLGLLAIIPDTYHVKADIAKNLILQEHPDAECITDWLPDDEIVRKLQRCVMTAFPYGIDCGNEELAELYGPVLGRIKEVHGISGAARMGLAAKRPVVVTHNCQFRDLEDYQDEVYFVENSLEATIAKVKQDIDGGCVKTPNKLLSDMDWNKCSDQYMRIYREVCGQEALSSADGNLETKVG